MRKGYVFHNPDGIYFITTAIVQWIDLFSRQIYRDILIQSLQYCQQHKGLVIYAYCIMSNHIHLVIAKNGDYTLSEILRDLKKFTSKAFLEAVQKETESRKDWMLWLFQSNGRSNPNNTYFQVWQQDNHPIELGGSLAFTQQKVNYVHLNPVRAGIVHEAKDYIYSSGAAYASGVATDGPLEVVILDI